MISHHHKTVFVHIPKCGGQSIETAFLNDLGLDWSTRAPLLLRENKNPLLGPPWLAHLLASDYVKYKYMTEEQFDTYYKFAVVRNPFSRVISLYNYLSRDLSLDDFIEGWLKELFVYRNDPEKGQPKNRRMSLFVRPQADYIFGQNERLVDSVFQLENIGNDISTIKEKTGLVSEVLHRNSSKKKVSTSDLSNRNIDTIVELYSCDFEILGYDVTL